MRTNTVFETSKFIVNNPAKFKSQLEEYGVRISLDESKEGFVLYGMESIFSIKMDDPEIEESDEDSICYFIQKHLRLDQRVQVKWLYYCDGPVNLNTSFYLITAYGIHRADDNQVFETMEKVILPRRVTCTLPSFNRDQKLWVMSGKKYLATSLIKKGNRDYYLIAHDTGQEVLWDKENFDE